MKVIIEIISIEMTESGDYIFKLREQEGGPKEDTSEDTAKSFVDAMIPTDAMSDKQKKKAIEGVSKYIKSLTPPPSRGVRLVGQPWPNQYQIPVSKRAYEDMDRPPIGGFLILQLGIAKPNDTLPQ